MRRMVALVLCAALLTAWAVRSTSANPSPSTIEKTQPSVSSSRNADGLLALKLPGPVIFETGSDQIKPAGESSLQLVKSDLDAHLEVTMLRIEVRNPDLKLAQRRAMSVARWLVAHGIDCNRLLPVAFGGTKAMGVSFVHAAIKGRAISRPINGGGQVAGDPCK